jgi:hypothetical protein
VEGAALFGRHRHAGDTTGNGPGTKWVAFIVIAEHLDHGTALTQRGLGLVLAA